MLDDLFVNTIKDYIAKIKNDGPSQLFNMVVELDLLEACKKEKIRENPDSQKKVHRKNPPSFSQLLEKAMVLQAMGDYIQQMYL